MSSTEKVRLHRQRKREGKRLMPCAIEILPGCKILNLEISEADAEDWLVANGFLSSNDADFPHLVNEAVRRALIKIGRNQVPSTIRPSPILKRSV